MKDRMVRALGAMFFIVSTMAFSICGPIEPECKDGQCIDEAGECYTPADGRCHSCGADPQMRLSIFKH